MKNTVTLVGFVGNNPEVRSTQSGASITGLSLATTRSFKDGQGTRQTETEWHHSTCFNGIGKSVVARVAKGAMIMVTGRIHYTKWADKDGTDRYGCEILPMNVEYDDAGGMKRPGFSGGRPELTKRPLDTYKRTYREHRASF